MSFFTKDAHRYTESPLLEEAMPRWRSRFVSSCLLLALLALGIGAFRLQVLNNEFFQEKGQSRYLREVELSASRGQIADRNGKLLAISTPMKSVWAIPAEASKISAEARAQLAALLHQTPSDLSKKLDQEKPFVFLERQMPPEQADRIANLKLPGIGQDKEYRRFYPNGDMTAHLVGFTNVDDKGAEGMELAFQEKLHGEPGARSVIKDRKGQIVEDLGSIRSPQDGEDVHLSIDASLQYLAYTHLKQAVSDTQSKAGGVIIADVKTGEILALVNLPTYNPNNRGRLSGEQLRNRAVTDTFEPGSTLKPFTATLALDQGKVRPETLINCAPGKLTIGTATISDAHSLGLVNVSQIIQKSSNIGMAKIADKLSYKDMWEMFERLGFGQVPKLGFPGEVTGRLRPWKSWRPIEQATMAYGHGISVSLVQLARAYTALAREGDAIPLSLLKTESKQIKGTPVFSQKATLEMRAMLELVVQPGGTAVKAQVPGYRVAGKTGTAYKIEKGKYVKKYVASFVGFAPASDPRLVVAVMLDEPSGGRHYGGDVAGPAFSAIMGSSLRNLGIPQDMPLVQAAEDKASVNDTRSHL